MSGHASFRNDDELDEEAKEYIREHGCWDCGSTIIGHHTPLCGMAGTKDKLDLPQIPGTQWWTECRDSQGNRVPPEKRPRIS